MIAYVREWNKFRAESEKLPISVEIELEKTTLLDLIPLGDIVIISKDFARHHGLNSMEEVIQKFKNDVRPE